MPQGRKPVMELTEKQRQVLKLLIGFVCRNGHQPTRDELAARMGTTPHAVSQKIWSLRDKGYLVMEEGRNERGLILPGIRFEAHLEGDKLPDLQRQVLADILSELE